jgi:hypothetical protein
MSKYKSIEYRLSNVSIWNTKKKCISVSDRIIEYGYGQELGCAIAQAVSGWLPTTAAQVQN